MRIAVLLSYYNRPDLLALCLRSLMRQTRKPDELILMDDGSDVPAFPGPIITYETDLFDSKKVVPRIKNSALVRACGPFDIYIRQEHDGFGKQRLYNKAVCETTCHYLVFLDQDCVVAPDWLEVHERIAKPNQMVYGMYTSLDETESKLVTTEGIDTGSLWERIQKRYVGEPPIWCGAGSACWKLDALRANGFDTRFGWCGGDYNFGLRLAKMGVAADHFCKYGRYFHLWHEKPWAEDKTDWRAGDRVTANQYAKEWAEQPVTSQGIGQQDMNAFEVYR